MLKGKTAIVTGSTSGIGLGIATALAAEGCDVMLNGFGEPAVIVLGGGLTGHPCQLLQQGQRLQLQRVQIERVAFARHIS